MVECHVRECRFNTRKICSVEPEINSEGFCVRSEPNPKKVNKILGRLHNIET